MASSSSRVFVLSLALATGPSVIARAEGAAPPARAGLLSNALNPAISLNALVLFGGFVDRAKPGEGLDEAGRRVAVPGDPYGVELQEAELQVTSVVDPFWDLNGMIVLASEGVAVEEIYARTTSLPAVTVKVGRMKAGFGRHGVLHRHQFPFVQPPLAVGTMLGEEGYRDVGAEVAWLAPAPWFLEFTGGGYAGAGGGRGRARGARGLDLGSARKDDFAWLGRVRSFHEVTRNGGLDLGASCLAGRGSDDRVRGNVGVDVTLKDAPPRTGGGAFAIQGEWLRRFSETDPATGKKERTSGWYAGAQYRFARAWWIGTRFDEVARVRAETAVFEPRDENGDTVQDTDLGGVPLWNEQEVAIEVNRIRRLAAGLVWAPSEFSAARLEYTYGWTDAGGVRALDRRTMVQLNYTIGAHPAHAF